MELQRQPMQIFETADCGAAHRALRHGGEQILLGFGEHLLAKAGQRVAGDNQKQHLQREAGILIDHIDGGAIHQRRDDIRTACRDKRAERRGDAPANTPVAFRRRIAPQLAKKRKCLVQFRFCHAKGPAATGWT